MTTAYRDRVFYCPACHSAHTFTVRADFVPDFSDPYGEPSEFHAAFGLTCHGLLYISALPPSMLETAIHRAMMRPGPK